ncbi:hypothetical protein OHR86_28170 [Streptomyces sp. NBC_00441]|uniref:hypothetical protein n=1 Tax=Streptomyces sp. NBC_00441 TaxID=2975742 RepID=UPI002E2DAA53|nr:hypothetical protein [Streptomyces sp. NBC_00441]
MTDTPTTPDPTAADDPTPLRWGLNDTLWGDDGTVIVCMSGPDREPYWLELDPEQAAVLRVGLAGPPPAEADDTPMTPAREQEIRTLDLLALMSDRAAPVISGHLAVLLAEVDRLRARVAELEAAELPDEHPMDRATRLGATRIPEDIVIEVCEATNTGRPTGWHVWADRDGEIWEVTDQTYDGDTVLMPSAGDMEPMLRRDVEKHFGPLTPKADW